MNISRFTSNWKTHLLFASCFLAAIAFSIVAGMVAGDRFLSAVLNASTGIALSDILITIILWSACVCYESKDEWSSSFTVLNLRG